MSEGLVDITDGLGVIFDMDGVLVDSYRPHLQSWWNAGQRFGVRISEDDFARTFGRTSREVIREIWPGRFADQQVAEFDLAKEAAYRDILQRDFPAMRGADELIAALHGAGFRIAIGSSGPAENVEIVKQQLRSGDLISATVSGSEVKHGKPDPDIFLRAAQKLKLDARRVAVIEDAPVGLEAAKRAGMTAIGLTGTTSRHALNGRAALVVDSLSELTPHRIAELIRLNAGSENEQKAE